MPTIERIPKTSGDSSYRIQADLVDAGQRTRVWFESNGFPLDDTIDPFVALALLPAMARNRDIAAAEPVSLALRSNVFRLHDQLRWRIPGIQAVAIDAPARTETAPKARGMGVVVDGGIDSLATLVAAGERATHAILVHGLETRLGDSDERRRASDWLERLSNAFGLVPIEISTNLRDWTDPRMPWERFHPLGPTAAVAAALSPVVGDVRLPGQSPTPERPGAPSGASLMGTERVAVTPDDAGTDRVGRYERVASVPGALRWLRPCRKHRFGSAPCGECPDCFETLIALQTLGMAEQCPDFKVRIPARRIAALRHETEADLRTAQRFLNLCERHGKDPELAKALRRSLGEAEPKGRRWWSLQRLVSR
ncbi:MAG: hypothetical protein ACKO5K_11540 [Armatimonadota bacterium]